MTRPNIGRTLCVRVAPLALGSLSAFSLLTSGAAVAAQSDPATVSGGASAPNVDPIAPAAPQAPGDPFAAATARRRPAFAGVHGDLNVLAGQASTFTGLLRPAHAGHLVELQRRGRHGWHTLAHSFTGAAGRFRLRYVPWRLDSERLRVLFPGDGAAAATARRAGVLNVFRLAGASWYGGGGSLACGGWLTGSTLGVANKTLPCGTRVTLRYGSRSIRVPVVDRGPYVAGRDFDLTEATKRALGFEGVGKVWSSR
ncbi:MAG TPA: septal ring lytic transglycosylase RlpA family protein [Solirubrobacteraceae bacterium]|nr:septal ring lytic transglycosylase RlpA family protein [Solirubrobacteraceae bacterium]